MTSADGGQRELILRVATRLFAALGYDSTSTSQIAEAAGLNVASVNEHVGSKRELYLAVMERSNRAERASMEGAIKGPPARSPEETAVAVHRVIDRYLDFCLTHPEVPALWMHRWLSDASDVTELERQYVQPLIKLVADAFGPAIAAGYIDSDTDVEYVLQSVIWSVHGFARGGVLDAEGNRRGTEDPEALRRFRTYLHKMIHRTIGLPGNPP
ncbi:TetR/AcrR family transcriptional regulator [Streptosporangium sp. NPDC000396]|uniref:TetR/AcrR family transcriptional regulator n=1 Tax=Streptosporangium sp. NPDC000396 TaxID=3366185 RepID=UPI0036B7145A